MFVFVSRAHTQKSWFFIHVVVVCTPMLLISNRMVGVKKPFPCSWIWNRCPFAIFVLKVFTCIEHSHELDKWWYQTDLFFVHLIQPMVTWWWVILNIPGCIRGISSWCQTWFFLGFNRLTLFLENWSKTSCLRRTWSSCFQSATGKTRPLNPWPNPCYSCKAKLFLFENIIESSLSSEHHVFLQQNTFSREFLRQRLVHPMPPLQPEGWLRFHPAVPGTAWKIPSDGG